jgi:hypothetical protein
MRQIAITECRRKALTVTKQDDAEQIDYAVSLFLELGIPLIFIT